MEEQKQGYVHIFNIVFTMRYFVTFIHVDPSANFIIYLSLTDTTHVHRSSWQDHPTWPLDSSDVCRLCCEYLSPLERKPASKTTAKQMICRASCCLFVTVPSLLVFLCWGVRRGLWNTAFPIIEDNCVHSNKIHSFRRSVVEKPSHTQEVLLSIPCLNNT